MTAPVSLRAANVPSSWAGRRIQTTTAEGHVVSAVLSDVQQHKDAHTTTLFMGGNTVEIHENTQVTVDELGIGGAK